MNINNIFGGILGFVMSMSLLFLFWTPVSSFIDSITNTELKIFLYVSFVTFCFILGLIVPINLATSDDEGNQ